MDREYEDIIRKHLEESFETRFFDACLANLREERNLLRLNNFAYAMRELIRNVLSRLAPDADVVHAPWYKQNPDTCGPTRYQRMKYAVQGWLSNKTMHEQLHINIDDLLSKLKSSIDDLSRFTHVGTETFDADNATIEELSERVLKQVANLFESIEEKRKAVHDAVLECVDEDMVQQFYLTTIPEIDELATHPEVEYYWVHEIEKEDDGEGCVHVKVVGSVDVRLQYGSDGDMRRDIGWETDSSYPFTAELEVSYKNVYGDIRILEEGEYKVDVDSFYE